MAEQSDTTKPVCDDGWSFDKAYAAFKARDAEVEALNGDETRPDEAMNAALKELDGAIHDVINTPAELTRHILSKMQILEYLLIKDRIEGRYIANLPGRAAASLKLDICDLLDGKYDQPA